MAALIVEIMTTDPATCAPDATIVEVARRMRDAEIGDVLVVDADGMLAGIVTDRDIVVNCLAEGRGADETIAGAFTTQLATLSPRSSVQDAEDLMKGHALRRVPVVDAGRPVGIVSLGDLAIERQPDSALGRISAAPPNG